MSRASEDSSTKAVPRSTWRRAFELSGVVPLLAFVLLHVVDAARGQVPERTKYSVAFEVGLVWLPLAFHVAYAARQALRPQQTKPSKTRNQQFGAAAAWLSLAFVVLHTWHVRVPVLRGVMSRDAVQLKLMESLSSTVSFGLPLWALAYTLGVAATAAHIAVGTVSFLTAEGSMRQPKVARALRTGIYALGLGIFFAGFDAIALLATGTHFWLAAPGGTR